MNTTIRHGIDQNELQDYETNRTVHVKTTKPFPSKAKVEIKT